MMLSASVMLLMESVQSAPAAAVFAAWYPQVAGCVAGIVFILLSKRWLDHHQDLKFNGMQGAAGTPLQRVAHSLSVSVPPPPVFSVMRMGTSPSPPESGMGVWGPFALLLAALCASLVGGPLLLPTAPSLGGVCT